MRRKLTKETAYVFSVLYPCALRRQPTFMPGKDAARMYSVSLATFRRWSSSGIVPEGCSWRPTPMARRHLGGPHRGLE